MANSIGVGGWFNNGSQTATGGTSNLVPVQTASGVAWVSPEEAAAFRQASENAANENARRWETGISMQKKQLDQEYRIAKMNVQSRDQDRELDREYKEKSYQLAVQAHQLEQGKFGLDIANTAANVASTPEDYFKLADLQRGLPGVPGASAALNSLATGAALQPMGGPAGGQATTMTLGGLTQKLMNAAGGGAATGGGQPDMNVLMNPGMIPGTQIQTTGNPAADSYLMQANKVALAGAAKLKPGSLESLDPLEGSLFGAALKRTGWSPSSFLSQYDATRPGQGSFGSA